MSSVTPPAFIPRSQRAKAWGERASAAAYARGARALDAAGAHIDAVFGPSRVWLDHKIEIDRAMARGAWDFDVRVEWQKIALLCPKNLAGAIREIERNYRAEIRHQDHLDQLFAPHANRARQRRLFRAKLFLRWFRRFGDVERFPDLIDALTTSVHYRMQAAQ